MKLFWPRNYYNDNNKKHLMNALLTNLPTCHFIQIFILHTSVLPNLPMFYFISLSVWQAYCFLCKTNLWTTKKNTLPNETPIFNRCVFLIYLWINPVFCFYYWCWSLFRINTKEMFSVLGEINFGMACRWMMIYYLLQQYLK